MFRIILWYMWGCVAWFVRYFMPPYLRLSNNKEFAQNKRNSRLFNFKMKLHLSIERCVARSRVWAQGNENIVVQNRRQRFSEEHIEVRDPLLDVYDKIQNYILTGLWNAEVRGYYAEILAFSAAFYFAMYVLDIIWSAGGVVIGTFSEIDLLKVMFFGASLLFILSLIILKSLLKQVQKWQKFFILLAILVITLIWLNSIADMQMTIQGFVVSCLMFVSGLIIVIFTLVRLLQWRLLYVFTAIGNWAGLNASPYIRHNKIMDVAALLLLVPNSNGDIRGMNSKDMQILENFARIEREGAEWRSLIFAIIALFGAIRISEFLDIAEKIIIWAQVDEFSTILNGQIIIYFLLALVAVGWAVFTEIWLSEYPNRVVSLACVRAQHYLDSNENNSPREFENYRLFIVNDANPISDDFGPRWIIVIKYQMDNKWYCLVRKNSHFGGPIRG